MASSQEACSTESTLEGKHSQNDKAASNLMCNIAIADITKISVDDFVKQITLIDMSYFAAIKRSEFLSLKWNGRDKKIYAPNIVESTRWFNQINFWVQKEILKYSAVNKRTEMLSYFIKLAKHLVDVNNLYSAMSIVSALQVECIYRLRLTWSGLGHRERSAYRRLEELFGQQDNCRLLREHTASMRLPGIPYLVEPCHVNPELAQLMKRLNPPLSEIRKGLRVPIGDSVKASYCGISNVHNSLYLSDLIYTNVAHPRINGQPTTVWVTKLNTIVDAIAHFQQSRFPYQVNESIRAYLVAQSYIEELQKFLEDANYKVSLHLEPPLIMDTPPPAPLPHTPLSVLTTNGVSATVEIPPQRRNTMSAVTRSSTPNSTTKSSLPSGNTSDQDVALVPRKKTVIPISFKSFSKALTSEEASVTEEDGDCCGGKSGKVSKLCLSPNPVGLLGVTAGGCNATVAMATFPKAYFIGDMSALKGESKECSSCKSPKLCSDTGYVSSECKSSLGASTHDQEVQVPSLPSSDSSSSTLTSPSTTCLLCGRSSDNQASFQKEEKSHSDLNSLPTGVVTGPDPLSIETPIIPFTTSTSSPPKSPKFSPSTAQGSDIYSAVLAVANLATSQNLSAAVDTQNCSDLHASFRLPSRSKEDICNWPPINFPFITAMRPSCVLCEGPLHRKTVGRLIPPGLEQSRSGSGLMTSSTFSNDSRCVSPCPSTAQPQQRYPRRATWKPFWSALVVMEGWSSAFMVYFDAVTKKPKRREDFSTGRCQIQPFQRCAVEGGGLECPPSIGLARHRNGTVDETSFLLTHPGLHKTYRLRPLNIHESMSGASLEGAPLTPTPPRRESRRLFFTLSRKNSTSTATSTPSHTPVFSPYASFRGRGSSAPMLAAITATQKLTDFVLRPTPSVEDWLHALQATLDHIQS